MGRIIWGIRVQEASLEQVGAGKWAGMMDGATPGAEGTGVGGGKKVGLGAFYLGPSWPLRCNRQSSKRISLRTGALNP